MAVKQQSAERNYKEMKLEGQAMILSLLQTKEEVIKANDLLLTEREESSHKTATINKQKDLYKQLKCEMSEKLNKIAQMEGLHHSAYKVQIYRSNPNCTVLQYMYM